MATKSALRLPGDVRERIRGLQAPLRPARNPTEAIQRERFVKKARAAKQKIAQLFIDCASWNDNARKPGETPIDCDPDGDLAAILKFYEAILKHDTQ